MEDSQAAASFCLEVQQMDRETKQKARAKRQCTGCIWRMRDADSKACSLPRCVNAGVRLGPDGCWTYRKPVKKCK